MAPKPLPRPSFLHRMLNPAIGLMNRLRFPQKFALISLLFLLPLAFVMLLLIREINSNINLVDRELAGTMYLRAVRNLYQDTLQNQIEVAHFQNGRISADEVRRIRSEIAQDMQVLERAEAQAQGILETGQAFQTLRADWQKLQAQPLDET